MVYVGVVAMADACLNVFSAGLRFLFFCGHCDKPLGTMMKLRVWSDFFCLKETCFSRNETAFLVIVVYCWKEDTLFITKEELHQVPLLKGK